MISFMINRGNMPRQVELKNLKRWSLNELHSRYDRLKDEHYNVKQKQRDKKISSKNAEERLDRIQKEVIKTRKAIQYKRQQ